MKKILIINGPNLNMLGTREPEKYGELNLEEINQKIIQAAANRVDLDFFQSNTEGEIIDKIQESKKKEQAIIMNAGAYTHSSIAIRDALLAVEAKFIEVHLSNIYQREDFRHRSYLSDIAVAVISGLGSYGYIAALEYLIKSK